ncbi:MAG TPA: DNA polymerase III subunit gamma/tau [Candidatus Dormibacteraeota bacterium]|nr:DNA polymerase III subunit gamma/tau [Candidatus Dormibacteraeota bacterium]
MSLYRAWRPKSFSELVGQDSVVRTLTSALAAGKLAHAYLFSGPRGSGKTSAAKILARCIDCVAGPTPTPDNTCENCRAIIDGTALDVLEIDAASNRGIDEIRALRDAVKFAPSAMRMKVYIIDEAHMLTKEGANAFLRTLEEPPPHAVFILATTEPERLPVTILSRCQRYAFRRISIPVIIARMREIAQSENIRIDDAALAAIAYRADGGLRDALTMLEQAAAFGGNGATIDAKTIDLAFGSAGREQAAALVDAVLACDASAALRAIEEASDAGADLAVLTRTLVAEFRNILVARIDPQLLARDLAPEDAARATRIAPDLPQTRIVRALRVLSDALALARMGGNPRLELETALLRFMLEQQDVADTAPPKRREAQPSVKAPPAPPPQKAVPKSQGDLSLQHVRAAWQSIRSKAEGQRQSLRAPLSRAVVEAVDAKAITLGLPEPWIADALLQHAKLIERAIEDVLGVALAVKVRVDGSVRANATAPEPEDADELFDYASEVIRER